MVGHTYAEELTLDVLASYQLAGPGLDDASAALSRPDDLPATRHHRRNAATNAPAWPQESPCAHSRAYPADQEDRLAEASRIISHGSATHLWSPTGAGNPINQTNG